MLRALNLTLPFAKGRMTRRRHRRFAPSLAGASSCLEDRVVLSAAGSVATPAPPLPPTPAPPLHQTLPPVAYHSPSGAIA
jgi:hypothetical protein